MYAKVVNVSAVLLAVMALKGVMAEEVIMMVEEEAVIRQEEEAFLAAELLINLLRAFIRDRIIVIIII